MAMNRERPQKPTVAAVYTCIRAHRYHYNEASTCSYSNSVSIVLKPLPSYECKLGATCGWAAPQGACSCVHFHLREDPGDRDRGEVVVGLDVVVRV